MTGVALLVLLSVAQLPIDESRTISSGRAHRVALDVNAPTAVIGQLDQGEVDLTLTVHGPDGRPIGEFDTRERSAEPFAFVADRAGRYWLEVRTVAANVRAAAFRLRAEQRPVGSDVDRRVEAVALHTEAKRLFWKGDRDSLARAVEGFRRARLLWVALTEPTWELAALAGAADALYTMSDYGAAKATYLEALGLGRSLGDVRTQAEILNNLAMVAWPLGEVENALEWLREAQDDWRTLAFPYGEAIAISNRGILLWEAGEYDEARQHYTRALGLFEKIDDPRGLAYVLNNLGVLLEALGEHRQALAYLGRAIPLFRNAHDGVAEGKAEVRRSRIQLAQGDRLRSQASIERALRLIRLSADRLAEADALAQRARVLEASGRGALARDEFHKTLRLYRDLGSGRGMADSLHDLGTSHLTAGDADNAIAYLDEALVLRRALGLRGLEAETLFQIAQGERARGNLDRARRQLEAALELVEALRIGVLEKQVRATYAESKQQYYAVYIDLLIDCHRAQPRAGYDGLAFEAAERARARGLTELLRESWSGVAASVPRALVQREQALRKEINYWSWRLWQQAAQPDDAARQLAAAATVTRLLAEHDQAVGDIRRSDPRYAAILTPASLPIDTIQKELIDQRTVLVSYHLGRRRSFVWVVTDNAVEVHELPARSEIEGRAARYLNLVTSHADAGRQADAAAEAAAAGSLARAVLQPIREALRRGRILIVADGLLHAVPFAALSVPGAAPLVLNHDVVMTHSATVLTLLGREVAGRARAPRVLAAFADPVFDRADPRVRLAAPARPRSRTGSRLSRLPHSRDEADRILAMVPPALRLKATDFAASRALATSPAIGDYRFVHFATHAIQNIERPSLSGIVLSMVDPTGADQDGFLRLQDVYNLRLRADLVVLSACETGTGRASSGDGVASLARGLFHAGAARVLSTLWRVDDEATAFMMQAFYRHLLSAEASTAAAALRAAQLEMRGTARWSHPFYWAGFILQGQW